MDHLPLNNIPMLVSSINFLLRDEEFDLARQGLGLCIVILFAARGHREDGQCGGNQPSVQLHTFSVHSVCKYAQICAKFR